MADLLRLVPDLRSVNSYFLKSCISYKMAPMPYGSNRSTLFVRSSAARRSSPYRFHAVHPHASGFVIVSSTELSDGSVVFHFGTLEDKADLESKEDNDAAGVSRVAKGGAVIYSVKQDVESLDAKKKDLSLDIRRPSANLVGGSEPVETNDENFGPSTVSIASSAIGDAIGVLDSFKENVGSDYSEEDLNPGSIGNGDLDAEIVSRESNGTMEGSYYLEITHTGRTAMKTSQIIETGQCSGTEEEMDSGSVIGSSETSREERNFEHSESDRLQSSALISDFHETLQRDDNYDVMRNRSDRLATKLSLIAEDKQNLELVHRERMHISGSLVGSGSSLEVDESLNLDRRCDNQETELNNQLQDEKGFKFDSMKESLSNLKCTGTVHEGKEPDPEKEWSDEPNVIESSSEKEHNNIVNSMSRERKISATRLFLSSGAAILPHPSKALTGGDDAYFMACENWFGVADGHGHWSFEAINAGFYSKELMESCAKFLEDCETSPGTNPGQVLSWSASAGHSSGPCTVLIAFFDGKVLQVANVGDCGFIAIRNGDIFARSKPMFYEFLFPIQIGRGDDPSQLMEQYEIDLKEGDVIVAGTDGLFDNLYDDEIAAAITKLIQAKQNPKEMAKLLVARAQENGRSLTARSPFADAAYEAGYVTYSGGKLDDATAVVSIVQCSSL